MDKPTNHLVSIVIPVLNGQQYIRHCLEAVLQQSYQLLEVIIFDNGSTDQTLEVVKNEFPSVKIYQGQQNLYVGPALNEALRLGLCRGEYILLLCVDVILDTNFILRAVQGVQRDRRVGVIQAKIFRFDLQNDEIIKTNTIDTMGFDVYRSRRVVNRGHGEEDRGQFDQDREIISYEGAAGFFNKQALDACRIDGEIMDTDFGWMVDDLDLGWRLTLLGWKNYYVHDVICYHDRKTTKRLSSNYWDFIKQRRNVPAPKRKLDYRNMHLTLIKNDVSLLLLRDFWYIFLRELKLFIYILLFEWSSLSAFWEILMRLPRAIKKRVIIMKRRNISMDKLNKFFLSD